MASTTHADRNTPIADTPNIRTSFGFSTYTITNAAIRRAKENTAAPKARPRRASILFFLTSSRRTTPGSAARRPQMSPAAVTPKRYLLLAAAFALKNVFRQYSYPPRMSTHPPKLGSAPQFRHISDLRSKTGDTPGGNGITSCRRCGLLHRPGPAGYRHPC